MSRTHAASTDTSRGTVLTDAQHDLLGALDDAVEHVHWKFSPEDYQGVATCGFGHIGNISGNTSFYRSLVSLADTDATPNVRHQRGRGREGIVIDIGGIEAVVSPAYKGGFRLSITNTQDLLEGPSYQRLDAQKRLHRLLLERLQVEHGYLDDARVVGRVD